MARPALLLLLLALAGCAAPPEEGAPEPTTPLRLFPAPRYVRQAGVTYRVAAVSTVVEPGEPTELDGLDGEALAVWRGGAGRERYAVRARLEAGGAVAHLWGESERARAYAADAAGALHEAAGRFHPALIVDAPGFATRGLIEGYYGPPLGADQRRCLVAVMPRLRQNLYLYGPKDDPFAHQRWAEPYPPETAQALAEAAAAARAGQVDFVWSVSPGLLYGSTPPGTSISYASAADFARLTAKVDAMRALGIARFALFLDDIVAELVHDADRAAFATPAAAHVDLANRLDDYVTAAGAPHLFLVGPHYTTAFAGWEAWTAEVGAKLRPGIEVMWTGPKVYSETIRGADLTAPNAALRRQVVLWDNQPQQPLPLQRRPPDLPRAARGLLSNLVMLQYRFSFEDFWAVLGTLADAAWDPDRYDPLASYGAWQAISSEIAPCL